MFAERDEDAVNRLTDIANRFSGVTCVIYYSSQEFAVDAMDVGCDGHGEKSEPPV